MDFITTRRFATHPAYTAPALQRYARPFTAAPLQVVRDGSIGDPFFRSREEKPARSRRNQHLGADIYGPGGGGDSITAARRGAPVYAAVRAEIPIAELNTARAFDKRTSTALTGVGLSGTGTATLAEAKVAVQPWTDTSNHAYGGVIGISCVYNYSGGQFTLYMEALHLITERFLPKDESGRVATLAEWHDTGRGIGFGPEMVDGALLPLPSFAAGAYPLIGYLGATQTPHVHVQAAFFSRRTFSHQAEVRVDPMVVFL